MPSYRTQTVHKTNVIIIKSEEGKHEVTDGDGKPVHGVIDATIKIKAGDLGEASLTLGVHSMKTVVHNPDWFMSHPETGKILHIKKIEFEDGSVWPPKHVKGSRVVRLKARTDRQTPR